MHNKKTEKLDIIVIANTSDDNSIQIFKNKIFDHIGIEKISKWYIITNNIKQENKNYVNSVNEAIKMCTNDVLFITTDYILNDGCVERLHSDLYKYRECGAIAPYSNEILFGKEITGATEFFEKLECVIQYFFDEPIIDNVITDCFILKQEILKFLILDNVGDLATIKHYIKKFGYKCVLIKQAGAFKVNYSAVEPVIKIDDIADDTLKKNVVIFKFANALGRKSKNVLHVIHMGFTDRAKNNVGGTQNHVKDIVNGLSSDYNSFVMYPEDDYIYLEFFQKTNIIRFRFNTTDHKGSGRLFEYKIKEIILNILQLFRIDLVHVHHTFGLGLDIFNVADLINIPTIFSAHDFYYICPTINMIDANGKYCSLEKESDDICKNCFLQFGKEYSELAVWRFATKSALETCKYIIFPSQFIKDKFNSFGFVYNNREKIIDHGIDFTVDKNTKNEYFNQKKRIAFIGDVYITKGSKTILEMLKIGEQYDWYIFGNILDEEIKEINAPNVYKYGKYKREELFKLLNEAKIDLVCILSIVPETFCYTLSEAVASGIPTLTTNIGALGSRANNLGCGWVVDYKSSGKEVVDKINEVFCNDDEYMKIKKHVSEIHIKSIRDMLNDYIKIYDEVIAANQGNKKIIFENDFYTKEKVIEAYLYANNLETDNFDHNQLELYQIKNTLGYKALCAFRKINIPGINIIKNILKQIIK